MKKSNRTKLKLLLLMFFFFFCPYIGKAKGVVTTSWDSRDLIYIGETIDVILRVDTVSGTTNDQGLSAFGGYIEYDKEKLELISYQSLAPFLIRYVDPKIAGVGTEYINSSCEIIQFTFRAKKLGNAEVSYLNSKQPDTAADPVDIQGSKKTIRITDPTVPLTLDEKEVYLLTGGTRTLTATYNLEGTVTGNWFSQNPEIVSVDSNGFIIGMKEGKTTVSYVTENGYRAICEVTVSNYLKGDVNRDRKVTIKDAMEIMYFYTKKKVPDMDQLVIGDMNNDEKLTLKDSNLIIAQYLKK